MARYGRDTEKHVFSFMDGVPVKISEQFKPPRKVGLPAGYQQRLSVETISEEYNFSLEQSVLQKMGEWRKLRKAAAENRKERAQSRDSFKQSKQSTPVSVAKDSDSGSGTLNIPSNSVSSNPTTATTYTSNNSNFASDNNSILTPIQIVQPPLEPEHSLISNFNFSDFEADTSSPFDNMELKTINEMEVLAHVLQPLSHSPDTNKHNNFTANSMHCNALETQPTNLDKNVKTNNFVNYNGHIYETSHTSGDNGSTFPDKQSTYNYCIENNGQGPYDFFLPDQIWTLGESNHSSVITDPQSLPIDQLEISNSIQSSYANSKFANSQLSPPQHIPHESINSISQETQYSSNLGSLPVSTFPEYYCPTFSSPNQGADRSQSKSVPDIVQELETELKSKELNRKAGLSPRPSSFGSVGLENWQPWPVLDSPVHLRSCMKKPSSEAAVSLKNANKSILPNPFDDLSPAAQLLTLHISEMGFNLPRVARACQAVGLDDKKIVEYLLQIQSLEDENYPGDRAERALVTNGYDRDQAVLHLEAMEQLLGLGFKEQQIFDALVRFENDRDKALDSLIS